MQEKFLNLIEQDDYYELYIYGDIVPYSFWSENSTAIEIKDKIINLDTPRIDVHINSNGGDVFTGLAIYNLLVNHKAQIHVYIDSIAASIASVIAMAGDKVYMPVNTMMMIHNCYTYAVGNPNELRKTADDMDKIMDLIKESYLSKVNIDSDKLQSLLDSSEFLTARECIEMGFADELIPLKVNSAQNDVLNCLIDKVKGTNQKQEHEVPATSQDNKPKKTVIESFFDELLKNN